MRSIIPVRLEKEDFVDPDEHFKTLPYYDEIPQLYNDTINIAPWYYGNMPYSTCREKMSHFITFGFFAGYFTYGKVLAFSMFGYSVNRWRFMWC